MAYPAWAVTPICQSGFSSPEFISGACGIGQITSHAVSLITYGDLVLRIDFIGPVRWTQSQALLPVIVRRLAR